MANFAIQESDDSRDSHRNRQLRIIAAQRYYPILMKIGMQSRGLLSILSKMAGYSFINLLHRNTYAII